MEAVMESYNLNLPKATRQMVVNLQSTLQPACGRKIQQGFLCKQEWMDKGLDTEAVFGLTMVVEIQLEERLPQVTQPNTRTFTLSTFPFQVALVIFRLEASTFKHKIRKQSKIIRITLYEKSNNETSN